ncbi:hypothetical protein V6N13_124243 [Hibiscus sabdariffa]
MPTMAHSQASSTVTASQSMPATTSFEPMVFMPTTSVNHQSMTTPSPQAMPAPSHQPIPKSRRKVTTNRQNQNTTSKVHVAAQGLRWRTTMQGSTASQPRTVVAPAPPITSSQSIGNVIVPPQTRISKMNIERSLPKPTLWKQ